jgi:hypothetical protein
VVVVVALGAVMPPPLWLFCGASTGHQDGRGKQAIDLDLTRQAVNVQHLLALST